MTTNTDFAEIAALLQVVESASTAAPGQLSHIANAAMARLKEINDDLAKAAAEKTKVDKAEADKKAAAEKAEAAAEVKAGGSVSSTSTTQADSMKRI